MCSSAVASGRSCQEIQNPRSTARCMDAFPCIFASYRHELEPIAKMVASSLALWSPPALSQTLGATESMADTMTPHAARLLGPAVPLTRRAFVLGAAGTLATGSFVAPARAAVPVPYDWNTAPP